MRSTIRVGILAYLAVAPALAAQSADSAVRAWVAGAAHPLGSLESDSSPADLRAFGEIAGNGRVVGIGENLHHIHEFTLARLRLVRFLVERRGFTALAMETGLAEAERLNAWVLGESEGPPDFGEGLPFAGDGKYTETQAALHWIREHNTRVPANRRVRFYGIDMPRGGGAISPALDELWFYLDLVDSSLAAASRARLSGIAERFGIGRPTTAKARYDSLDATSRRELGAGLMELRDQVRRRQAAYERASSRRDYLRAARLVEVALQTVAFARVDPYAAAAPRDSALAANVMWVLEREGPRGRVIVWAANPHVQRVAIDVPGLTPAPATSMGQRLAGSLGRDYVAVGMTFDRAVTDTAGADPQSVDGVLASAGKPPFFLDLRAAPAGSVRTWLEAPHPMRFATTYLRLAPAAAFDALIFIDRISPAREAGD